MSATAFHAIAQAIVAQLQAGTPVAARIERARSRPIPEQDASAVVVRLRDADAELSSIQGARTQWETLIVLECYARGTAASGEELVDSLVHDVHERLADDASLGGLVGDLQLQSIRWGTSAEADAAGDARLFYRVRHETENRTLT